jgi:hypothetical protein
MRGMFFVDRNRRIFEIYGDELCKGFVSARMFNSLGRYVEDKVLTIHQLKGWSAFRSLEQAKARIAADQRAFLEKFVISTGAQQ